MTGPEATTPECPRSDDGQHHMRDWRTGGKLIRMISQCVDCDMVDGAALDRWAEQAFKEQLSGNAQLIAVAAETEPFAFVQRTGEDLTLENVLFQALGAASMCWNPRPSSQEFDSTRAKVIGERALAEIRHFVEVEVRERGGK